MKLDTVFENAFNLNEIFDTSIPVDKWFFKDHTLIGDITIDNQLYQIVFEPQILTVNNKNYRVINIAFQNIDSNNQPNRFALLNTKNASKIIGAMVNGFHQKISQFEYDMIAFVARDHVEQRMRIYNYIARHDASTIGQCVFDIALPNSAKATLIFHHNLPKQDMLDIQQYISLKQADK